MAAALHDLPLIEHDNLVAEPAGGKAVADIHRRTVPNHTVETRVHFVFRHRIERCRRFVEHEERRVFIECPGQGNLLRFPAGDFYPVLLKSLYRQV